MATSKRAFRGASGSVGAGELGVTVATAGLLELSAAVAAGTDGGALAGVAAAAADGPFAAAAASVDAWALGTAGASTVVFGVTASVVGAAVWVAVGGGASAAAGFLAAGSLATPCADAAPQTQTRAKVRRAARGGSAQTPTRRPRCCERLMTLDGSTEGMDGLSMLKLKVMGSGRTRLRRRSRSE